MIEERVVGVLKWFNYEKGFGVISKMNSKDEIFLHISNLKDSEDVKIEKVLIFDISFERYKNMAKNCRYFNENDKDNYNFLYELCLSNDELYIYDDKNSKKNIFSFLDIEKITNSFIELVKEKFNSISNDKFLEGIKKEFILFEKFNFDLELLKTFINKEAFQRFSLSNEIEFKKKLLTHQYIDINNLIELDFILDNFRLNKEIMSLIKNHSDYLNNIYKVLERVKNTNFFKEILFEAMKNKIQNLDTYIIKYMTTIQTENIIIEYKNLKKLGILRKDTYLLKNKFKLFFDEITDEKLIIKGYKEKIIDLESFLNKITLNEKILNLIKKDQNYLNNIHKILERVKNSIYFEDILFEVMYHNIDNLDKYIDIYFSKIDKENILNEYQELDILLDLSSSIEDKYCLKERFKNFIYQTDDKDIIFEAYTLGILEISDNDLINNYLDKFDIELFKKIEKNLLKSIQLKELFKTRNSKLLEYIIKNFEKLNVDNYQVFFEIGIENLFNFDIDNQVLYIKKLFYLKRLNLIEFNRDDLTLFIQDDILDKVVQNDNEIDFSTYLIIDLINKFNEIEGFMATHELIKSVLRLVEKYPNKRLNQKIKLAKFFDECNGRSCKIAVSEKVITKEYNNDYYDLKIEFPYDIDIVNDVKNLKVRKYYPDEKVWRSSSENINEVINFGKKHKFLFRLGNEYNYFEINEYISKIKKMEIPKGIEFCCGQKAQNKEEKFWWCNQNPCYENNIKLHSNEEWEKYTLFDFMNILNLSLKETTKNGLEFETGLYIRFVTFLNRFNKLLDRLYCKECSHILYPKESSNYHKFSVTTFICKNKNCLEYNSDVYLNRCLNGQCNEIIDSRESTKCPNGWYICAKCGSCCSYKVFEDILKNKKVSNGVVYDRILKLVNNKEGHLEKAEYFCYKCGQVMTEYNPKLYKCLDCEIEYDLEEYSTLQKRRIHLDLRNQNYPKFNNILELKETILEEKSQLKSVGLSDRQIFGILFNKEFEINGETLSLKMLNNRQLTNELIGF